MKKIIIPAIAVFMSFSGCARKTIPNKTEQSKSEKKAATQTDRTFVSANQSIKNTAVRDTTKNVDTAYANYTYETLSQLYADTIAQNPNLNDTSLNYAKDFVGSVNFNLRKPNFVIIHHTSQDSVGETLHTFTMTRTAVSAHYVVGRDGSIHHLVNDYLRAWQAGAGKWGNITDMNSCSVGIELDNDGVMPFTDAQINSLLAVLTSLKKRFNIPAANFIAHADYAPERKNDPNVNFPWKLLSDKGFGLWWSDTTNVQVPQDFNEYQALRIIGYNVHDIVKTIIAFRRHFCGVESKDATLSPEERKILYCLYSKYL